jgi:transmembrane sensor
MKRIPPQIIDEASEWFVTMREPHVSAEDREAFSEWLRASPVHVGAYLDAARVWADASQIDKTFVADPADTEPSNVIALPTEGAGYEPWESRADAERETALQRGRRAVKSRRPVMAVAAAILLLALAGAGAWLYHERAPTYVTDIGEQRTITLQDGSVVRLNSRSELAVRMSPELREIELISGQALFDVAHDTARPFLVHSGNSVIRAVGTRFDVNRRQSGTTVTVIEGRVRLDNESRETEAHVAASQPDTSGSALSEHEIYLSAGEQMRVVATGAMERTPKPNTAAAISWLQQELIFEGQPLADVVEEFNRYTRTQIVLSDGSVGDLRINAVFHTTNPDSLLRFISRYEDVQIDRTGKEIRISRRH